MIVVTRRVAHGDLTGGVTDDVIVLDPERFEEIRESDPDERDAEDDVGEVSYTVGNESGLLSGDEETRSFDDRRLAVLSDQDLVIGLDSVEESGESRGKLATREDVLRILSGEDRV